MPCCTITRMEMVEETVLDIGLYLTLEILKVGDILDL